MRELYLDLSGGASGDMLLALLSDLGADLSGLAATAKNAGLKAELTLADLTRSGLRGKRADIIETAPQPLRHMPDLLAILDKMTIPPSVREKSAAALAKLAEAEAAVHGIPLERVHFHEVGAVDTLMDVAGVFFALSALGIERVTASPLPWFTGTVDCAHGALPLPAPATALLMRGKPVRPALDCHGAPVRAELVTPTGAALLDVMVDDWDEAGHGPSGPTGRILAAGLGWGSREIPGHFNGLRGWLLETAENATDVGAVGAVRAERVWELEAHIDHLTGEEIGHAITALMDAGALDACWFPAVMKKNRPGGALRAVCAETDVDRIQAAFFRETLTLGLRRRLVERVILEREAGRMATSAGEVASKRAHFEGKCYERPEWDDLITRAAQAGLTPAQTRLLAKDSGKTS